TRGGLWFAGRARPAALGHARASWLRSTGSRWRAPFLRTLARPRPGRRAESRYIVAGGSCGSPSVLNQQKETDLTRPFQDIAAAWGWLCYGSLREPSLRQPQADSHELSEFTAGTLHQQTASKSLPG